MSKVNPLLNQGEMEMVLKKEAGGQERGTAERGMAIYQSQQNYLNILATNTAVPVHIN